MLVLAAIEYLFVVVSSIPRVCTCTGITTVLGVHVYTCVVHVYSRARQHTWPWLSTRVPVRVLIALEHTRKLTVLIEPVDVVTPHVRAGDWSDAVKPPQTKGTELRLGALTPTQGSRLARAYRFGL